MQNSPLFKLNLSDAVKALIMAVLTPVFAIVYQSVQAGNLTFDWKAISLAAVSGFMAYLAKNFFSGQVPAK